MRSSRALRSWWRSWWRRRRGEWGDSRAARGEVDIADTRAATDDDDDGDGDDDDEADDGDDDDDAQLESLSETEDPHPDNDGRDDRRGGSLRLPALALASDLSRRADPPPGSVLPMFFFFLPPLDDDLCRVPAFRDDFLARIFLPPAADRLPEPASSSGATKPRRQGAVMRGSSLG
jgi:hypothetical protein